MSLHITVNTRDSDVQLEVLDRLDAVLSEFTDGRVRWGVDANDVHEGYEYEEDSDHKPATDAERNAGTYLLSESQVRADMERYGHVAGWRA